MQSSWIFLKLAKYILHVIAFPSPVKQSWILVSFEYVTATSIKQTCPKTFTEKKNPWKFNAIDNGSCKICFIS